MLPLLIFCSVCATLFKELAECKVQTYGAGVNGLLKVE